METLAEFAAAWKDTEESHKAIQEQFCALVNADPQLKAHRDFIEAGCWGFGDRSFHWMWKLILEEIPRTESRTYVEIGVHRGQVLSLWRLLDCYAGLLGVSTFDGEETGEKRDYRKDVRELFQHFGQRDPALLVGDSTRPDTIKNAQACSPLPWDILYVDGCHLKSAVTSDILNYAPMVAPGGYLVCDDSGNRLNMPWGFFRGHQAVSDAVDELLPPFGPDTLPDGSRWKHLASCVHNRIWQRI